MAPVSINLIKIKEDIATFLLQDKGGLVLIIRFMKHQK
jgi:hypothetical protein